MGYEVTVRGRVKFKDVEGFKKEFEKIAQHLTCEIGLHGDFDYFSPKIWGDNLEDLQVDEDGFVDIEREGKNWYDEDKAIELLAKYAYGTIEDEGEDGEKWRYIIDEDGSIRYQIGTIRWVDRD